MKGNLLPACHSHFRPAVDSWPSNNYGAQAEGEGPKRASETENSACGNLVSPRRWPFYTLLSMHVTSSRQEEVQKFGRLEIQKSGSSEVQEVNSSGRQKFGKSEVQMLRCARVQGCGSSDAREIGSSAVRESVCSEAQKFRSSMRAPGPPPCGSAYDVTEGTLSLGARTHHC